MEPPKGKGKGKGKRDWEKERGKVREKDWPSRGREGKGKRAEKGGRKPPAGSETVDDELRRYAILRPSICDSGEPNRQLAGKPFIVKWIQKLCLLPNLKC